MNAVAFLGSALLVAAGRIEAAPVPSAYFHAVDASAAAALDSRYFAAASDEENIIRIYDREITRPVAERDLSAFLEVDPKSPESDIEAVARIGETLYWITSHGRNKNGKPRPSRHRFFATRILQRDGRFEIEAVGRPYKNLQQDILSHPALAKFGLARASGKAPKESGGFNIEAMAATPEGHLLIGFRNPVPNGRAILVPLLNPEDLIRGGTAKLGEPRQLNLHGLGFRSLENRDSEFIIVAGSTSGNEKFEMFTWSGGDDPPRAVAQAIPPALNPESMVRYPDAPGLHLLSDDSSEPQNARLTRKSSPDEKSFRSGWERPAGADSR